VPRHLNEQTEKLQAENDQTGQSPASVLPKAEPASDLLLAQQRLPEILRLLVESIADYAVVMLDPAGHIVSWNPAAERLKGYRIEEVLGKHISSLYAPEDVAIGKPVRDLEAAAREGRFEFEGWRLRKDSSRFWAKVVITALRDQRGELLGFGNVTRDFTDRRRAADQFRLAIEASPTGMIMVDERGEIVLVNAQVEELFGYPRGELMGRSIEMLVPTRFRAHHPGFRTNFFADPQSRPMGAGRDLYGLRRDGTEMPIEIALNPLETPEGRFVLSSVVDITERKRAVEQFRLAIEAAPAGMIMVDERGEIVLVNAKVEELFGYPRGELMGRSIEMLVPQRFRAHHPGFRTNFYSDPKARPMGAGRDLYGLRKDGTEMPIEIGLNPLETPEGRFVLSSVVDITERKRVEQERENLLVRLQVSSTELERRVFERTAELSTTLNEREVLLQEIHHRVKNNLQIISSLMSLQLRQISDRATREALQEGQARVQAISLIHEMLYQSRDYANVPFSEYARKLAANVFSMVGVAADYIALDLAIDDVALAVDKAIPCGLILNELITNALKHAFPNGRHGTIRVALARTGNGKLQLSVEDDGVGMPAGFDIHQTHSLGVHLVATLAEQLGAELEMARDRGTFVKFTFAAGKG